MIGQITSVSEPMRDDLLRFCQTSCLGVKAIGPLLSYGTGFPFLDAYEQRDENGMRTAFMTNFYGSLAICSVPDLPDLQIRELREFFHMLGCRAVLAAPSVTGRPASGNIMMLRAGRDCRAERTAEPVSIERNQDLRAFFQQLTNNNPGYLTAEFEDWYVDVSHRIRHGTADLRLLKYGEKACATAAALSIADHAVFLGAVSTDPDFRGRHFAFTLLRDLADSYPDRTLYLMCRPEKTAFYEKAGMHRTDSFSEINHL